MIRHGETPTPHQGGDQRAEPRYQRLTAEIENAKCQVWVLGGLNTQHRKTVAPGPLPVEEHLA